VLFVSTAEKSLQIKAKRKSCLLMNVSFSESHMSEFSLVPQNVELAFLAKEEDESQDAIELKD
jgi:hypothetical protein